MHVYSSVKSKKKKRSLSPREIHHFPFELNNTFFFITIGDRLKGSTAIPLAANILYFFITYVLIPIWPALSILEPPNLLGPLTLSLCMLFALLKLYVEWNPSTNRLISCEALITVLIGVPLWALNTQVALSFLMVLQIGSLASAYWYSKTEGLNEFKDDAHKLLQLLISPAEGTYNAVRKWWVAPSPSTDLDKGIQMDTRASEIGDDYCDPKEQSLKSLK
ncbi:MAG: hypothetical protein CMF51_05225 [Legionellales bacterium]|nr:hypothetical protein [Legionellales bacterium]|tara:strand:- start:1388 stop:2047 length:660 start_codon:yes stop_codon:yes gene_type:complete